MLFIRLKTRYVETFLMCVSAAFPPLLSFSVESFGVWSSSSIQIPAELLKADTDWATTKIHEIISVVSEGEKAPEKWRNSLKRDVTSERKCVCVKGH